MRRGRPAEAFGFNEFDGVRFCNAREKRVRRGKRMGEKRKNNNNKS